MVKLKPWAVPTHAVSSESSDDAATGFIRGLEIQEPMRCLYMRSLPYLTPQRTASIQTLSGSTLGASITRKW